MKTYNTLIILISVSILFALSGFCFSAQKQQSVDTTTTPSTPSRISALHLKDITITILYDNNPYKADLQTAWGFSCVVRGTKKNILFDTGGDGLLLLRNMKRLGLQPQQIDVIVLSHIHGDHTGGLQEFLAKNHNLTVYLPASFPRSFKTKVEKSGAKVIEVMKPLSICEHVSLTGELGTWIKEQSLIIRTDKGIIIITGCAHPGVVNIVKKASELTNNAQVLLVLGGFHLIGKSKSELKKIVNALQRLGVKYVAPCHCSGDNARRLFKTRYANHYINAGAGKVISIKDFQ
ncbi:MBL fold metallo-hydrolase [Candidatus Sumerlaeota bacterium]|nr:MBL fold metallo-hydrolase [Candidatus Sumerlaeota bacterium]